MCFGIRFVYVVFCCTAILVLGISLRSDENSAFYKLCQVTTNQSRVKQQIWQKQMELESLLNPEKVSKLLEQKKE